MASEEKCDVSSGERCEGSSTVCDVCGFKSATPQGLVNHKGNCPVALNVAGISHVPLTLCCLCKNHIIFADIKSMFSMCHSIKYHAAQLSNYRLIFNNV